MLIILLTYFFYKYFELINELNYNLKKQLKKQ
jgi:hypothetical protein